MRVPSFASIFALLAACGGSHSNQNPDAPSIDTGVADTPSGTPHTIAVTLVNRPNTPATFSFVAAYQDGASAWQVAPAPAGDVYSFTVTSPVWGFAWTCVGIAGGQRDVQLYYFAVAERSSLSVTIPNRCSDRATAVGLGGTIANPPVQGALAASFGGRTVVAVKNANTTTYALETPPATRDLIVGHVPLAAGSTDVAVDSALVQRGVAVAAQTTANVDFGTAQPTTTAVVTVGTTAGKTTASTVLFTANGTAALLSRQTAAPFLSRGLATALAATGDVYAQIVRVDNNGAASIVQNWVTTIAAQTYSAPAALGGATSTVTATTPYPLIKTTWNGYANAIGYSWIATQAQQGATCGGNLAACSVTWAATMSPGYVGASPQSQMPDLSALAGWDAKLQLRTGTVVDGAVIATTSSAGASDFPTVDPAAAGTTRAAVSSAWTVTP